MGLGYDGEGQAEQGGVHQQGVEVAQVGHKAHVVALVHQFLQYKILKLV